MSTVYFATLARDQEVIERYLYDSAKVIETFTATGLTNGLTAAVVEVTGRDEADALYLAQYQADRLASGLYPVTPPVQTLEEVAAALLRWTATD